MPRKFGDIKPGDKIWRTDFTSWELKQEEVIKVKDDSESYIRVYLSGGSNILVHPYSLCYQPMWIWPDEGEAKKAMKENAIYRESEYIKRIDELISQYDNLLKWKKV